MQINETDILIYIVYNNWTTAMPLRGRTSPVAPFLCRAVKTYGKEKYSRNANAYALAVIHFSYSFNIYCFDSE